MHPAIKIVNLVIISIFLTQGGWSTLLLTGALLLPFYLVHLHLWYPAIKMLYRLKWFFISILFIYFYYTPTIHYMDSSLLAQYGHQLMPGVFRILVLIFILFSVNLFIKTTTKKEILSALLWLFLPLKLFNIDIERLSLRAVLTLEYIEVLSKRLHDYKTNNSLTVIPSKDSNKHLSFVYNIFQRIKDTLLHLIKHSGIIFCKILEEAESTSGKLYTLDCLEPPKLFQYIYPLLLLFLYFYSLKDY